MKRAIGAVLLSVFFAGIAVRAIESVNDRYGSVGVASWYGERWRGRKTANGDIFNPDKLTAAHRSLPFGTLVRVTNLQNDQQVTVLINDRGPFIAGRIIDLSKAAAHRLDMIEEGIIKVKLEIVRKQLSLL